MTAIDNETPTPEETEETTPAEGIAGSESTALTDPTEEASDALTVDGTEGLELAEEPEEEEPLSDRERALFDTVPSPNRNPFNSWSDFHWLVVLVLVIVALLGFGHTYIQDNKGSEIPLNLHGPGGACVTQYWHVPDRYHADNHSFEQIVASARAEGAADFRGSESCKVQIVR